MPFRSVQFCFAFSKTRKISLSHAYVHAHFRVVASLSVNLRPWHVFVDTSPDTDADFEVAATFDEEPSQDDVNFAIVECLEGSEREDELVAQQMQEALEAGQLDRVSEMLGMIAAPIEVGDLNSSTSSKSKSNSNSSSNAEELKATTDGDEDPTEDTNYYDDFDSFEEDSC